MRTATRLLRTRMISTPNLSQRDRSRRGFRSDIFLPMLLGFLARLAMFPFAHLEHPNVWEYGYIARNMLAGHGYSYHWSYHNIDFFIPSAWMVPGQVLIHYLGLWLFGDNPTGYTFIFVEDAVIGTLFILAMHHVLRLLFHNPRIVRLGTWMAALYPSFVFAASSFGVTQAVLTLDAFFFWALLVFAERLRTGKSIYGMALVAGLLAGAITQFRSESYALVPLSFLVVTWRRWRAPRFFSSLGVAALGCCVVLAPWVIRNAVVLHRFLPTSTTGSFNFWRGHNPNATGSSWHYDGSAVWVTDTMMDAMEPTTAIDSNVEFTTGHDEIELAKAWIVAHPGMELTRTLKKIALLWGVDWYSSEARNPLYIALYAMTLALFIAGIFRARREGLLHSAPFRTAWSLIALWCIFYTLIVMVFFSLPRLQIILIGFYFPLVVYGADGMLDRTVQFIAAKAGWQTVEKDR